jgi:hypothetical protein
LIFCRLAVTFRLRNANPRAHPFAVKLRTTLLAAVALPAAIVGCTRGDVAERTATMPAVPFDSVFRLADTLTPEQPDSAPLGLISGIDFAPDGSFVLTDVHSSQVRRYDAGGRLQRRMGRRGYGPGEFQMPMFPVIDARGRIHVLDLQQPRITVFDADGTFLRAVSTARLASRIGDLEVLPDGDYLLVAWNGERHDLLFRTDSLGSIRASYLPHAELYPEGQPAARIWNNVRNASLSVSGERAFVVTSLSDTLWTLDLRNGGLTAKRITPPGYVAPVAPRENMYDPRAFSRWARSWSNATLVRSGSRSTMVVFVRGILLRGDSAVAAFRSPGASWQGLTDLPIILTCRGDSVVTLLDPNAETFRFGVYVRR